MAKRWARLEGSLESGIAFEFVDHDPEGRFHPSLIFVEAPDDVIVGSHYAAGVWTPPPPPPEPEAVEGPVEPAPTSEPTYRTLVSKVEWYGLFEPLEEAKIRLIASKTVTAEMVEAATDAVRDQLMAILVLRVMLSRADNLAPDQMIDLADHQVQNGLALCEQMSCLEPGRPADISRGVLVSPA